MTETSARDPRVQRLLDESMPVLLETLSQVPEGMPTKELMDRLEARYGLGGLKKDWEANVRATRQQLVGLGLLHRQPRGHYRLTDGGLEIASRALPSSREIRSEVASLGLREEQSFEYSPGSALAVGARTERGFVVFEGATAAAKNTCRNYSDLKAQLVESGVLVPTDEPDLLQFTTDYEFASPSAAAAVIAGTDINGQQAWRLPSGQTIGGDRPSLQDARAWKIAPGENAWQWPECMEGGFIGVGWTELGDLSGTAEEEFEARLQNIRSEHPEWDWKKVGPKQAWTFSRIRIGDRVVANRGTREVLGVGTVTGPYYWVEGARNGHRLPVRWDDVAPRVVNEPAWQRTLLPLSVAKVDALLGGDVEERTPLRALILQAVETLGAAMPEGVTATEIAAYLDGHAPRPDGQTWKTSGSVIPGDFAVWQDDQTPVNWRGGAQPYAKLLERMSRTGEARYRVRPREAVIAAARQRVAVPDSCWWINIGRTLPDVKLAGGVWAWEVTAAGQAPAHAGALKDIEVGDLVFLNADSKIVAIAWVVAEPHDAARPQWVQEDRSDSGTFIPLEILPLREPLELRSIPREWRVKDAGPFDQNGTCKSVFVTPLDRYFASQMVDLCPDRFLGGQPSPPLSEETSNRGDYIAPSFEQIVEGVAATGMVLESQTLRRYHVALMTRGFVILSGLSGTGKTWLAQAYAEVAGAEVIVVPVAPNWNSNEDLLGYHNPMSGAYHDTAFSSFVRKAGLEFETGEAEGRVPRPFHLVLDEMNLARVEHYFAAFLSGMEIRSREGRGYLQLGTEPVCLPPNLVFVGTVNVDETTHGFADKVYDRAHLIELEVSREALEEFLAACPCRDRVMELWDALRDVAPFAFRVADDIQKYVKAALDLGATMEDALDEIVLQKLLPKVKGDHPRVGYALNRLAEMSGAWPLSRAKLERMKEGYDLHGIASFF